MTQIPILSGAYADEFARFRASYPINLEPVIADTGISKGYLSTAPGIVALADGLGADRGGFDWQGTHYRVSGSSLIRVGADGSFSAMGAVAGSGPVSFDYSFDRLGIAAGGNLFYYDGASIKQVLDIDLGQVVDMIWIDGYFMTTDGTHIVVTELNDPMAVNPLKYGSSEVSPDPIVGLIRVRGEAYAINRHTIENFRNVGGNGFPFQRNPGAMIAKGAVGTHAKVAFLDSFAFVGGGENEAVSVYIAGGGEALAIGTAEVDKELAALTPDQQAAIRMDARIDDGEQRLYVHLPTKTLVYQHQISAKSGEPIWHVLAGGIEADQPWPLTGLVHSYGRWIGGAPDGRIGYLSHEIETQFGQTAGWCFDTAYLYNESRGAILHAIELVGLPGRTAPGSDPVCWFSSTVDAATWSQERPISTGRVGQRQKRMQWRPHRRFGNYMGLRFRGADTALVGFARLEAQIEGLAA